MRISCEWFFKRVFFGLAGIAEFLFNKLKKNKDSFKQRTKISELFTILLSSLGSDFVLHPDLLIQAMFQIGYLRQEII